MDLITKRRWATAGLAALALAAACTTAHAATKAAAPGLQGQVTQVTDGRTLTVGVPGQPPLLLRLRDIEVPELCHPGGAEAQRMLADLALNKPAMVQAGGNDGQGRRIGTVRVDEADLSRRMVEEGYAWSTRSKWDRGPLVKEERMAHGLKRGLHATPGALSPAELLRKHGPCATEAPVKSKPKSKP